MSQAASIWALILLALVAANLPFFTRRLLGLVALRQPKGLALRLGELLLMYFAVGGFGLWLELRAGQIAPQGWEFYAVTASLFATLAFPGFVWQYLVPRRREAPAADDAAA
ncbi:MAG: hypothetical protein RL087_613 [Pseudomonadota bacterium]